MRINNPLYLALIALALFVAASTGAYEDEEAEQSRYCKMVNDGHWPNFKNVECK